MWEIIRTPEISINFCEELGLILRKDGECPTCPKCGNKMKGMFQQTAEENNKIKKKLGINKAIHVSLVLQSNLCYIGRNTCSDLIASFTKILSYDI